MIGTTARLYAKIGFEPAIWILSFLILALIDPSAERSITLCPVRLLGIGSCPGCGLGHSISYLLHGDIARSLSSHLLGIPASLILLLRTFSLLKEARQALMIHPSIPHTTARSAYAQCSAVNAGTRCR